MLELKIYGDGIFHDILPGEHIDLKQGISMKFIEKLIETGIVALMMTPAVVFAQNSDDSGNQDSVQSAPDAAVAADQSATAAPDAAVASDQSATAAPDAANANAAAPQTPASNMPEADTLNEKTLGKTLHEVSSRVDTLKEDTFTTKSRLLLLREEVLQRSVSGSRLILRHNDEMGGQYELRSIHYLIDNKPAFVRVAEGDDVINDIDDSIVYDDSAAPGTHMLTVRYVYRGKKWGVFKYMHSYAFVVESGYSFVLEEGKSAELVITAEEKGNVFTPYEERPTVSFTFDQFNLASDAENVTQEDGAQAESK